MSEQLQLVNINITRLKNLNNVDIRFDEKKPLTAIMGPNGFGKSTILHILAGLHHAQDFRDRVGPFSAGENRRFSEFFPSTPISSWAGTLVQVVNRRIRGDQVDYLPHEIVKNETGTWLPQIDQKPKRETYFIGVSSALPEVEVARDNDDITFQANTELSGEQSDKLKRLLGAVFNRSYTNIYDYQTPTKSLSGLAYGNIQYSSLSMGAGEQRVFRILKTLLACQKGALILVDELDVLLHTDALHKLIKEMHQIAEKKELQIIFTTHRETILNLNQQVAIRHLFTTHRPTAKTYCFNETKPDAIERLTGASVKPLEIACEDDVAATIVKHVVGEVKLSPWVHVTTFGSWKNSFTLAAALQWQGKDISNSLFVLDGDIPECATSDQKMGFLNKAFVSTEQGAGERKRQLLSTIREFASVGSVGPERALYDMIRSLPLEDPDSRTQEVLEAFSKVEGVSDKHEYVSRPIELLSADRAVGLDHIVAVAAKSTGWRDFTAPVRNWLLERKDKIKEAQD